MTAGIVNANILWCVANKLQKSPQVEIAGGIRVPLLELHNKNKVIGTKQVKKAIMKSQTKKAFFAKDAEPHITSPLKQLCVQNNIEFEDNFTMKELGEACGIDIGSAAVALLID